METGDLVSYRRVDVEASARAQLRGGVWVHDVGIVLHARQPRPPSILKDYLVRVFFPSRPDSPVRTLRASKLELQNRDG